MLRARLSTLPLRTARSMSTLPSLLSPAELAQLLRPASSSSSPGKLVLLDATWHMPNLSPPRHAYAEYVARRIPSAHFWDVDLIASHRASLSGLALAHMLPSAQMFQAACDGLGIKKEDRIVVYDSYGVFSSPRTAWTFKAYGHESVSVLDGGMARWVAEGMTTLQRPPVEVGDDEGLASEKFYAGWATRTISASGDKEEGYGLPSRADQVGVRGFEEMVFNSKAEEAGREVVLDARPAGRFLGTAPEPRAGLASGSIPHSLSLPFSSLLVPATPEKPYTTLQPVPALEAIFKETMGEETWDKVKAGEKGVVGSCGSGMTAAVLLLGLDRCGVSKTGLYDGSWTEYTQLISLATK